jgi:hypothetical protein
MGNRNRHCAPRPFARIAAALLLAAAPLAIAGLPVPSFVYYGEVVDAYGWPLTSDVQACLIARVNGRECGRSLVHEGRGPAINYRIEVSIGAAYAVHPGDPVTFVLAMNGVEHPAMDPARVPVVGQPGGLVRCNLCIGSDADHDDLPDEWESRIIAWSGGVFTNIAQVVGTDDFDGDGVNNRDEFLAGTDPSWDVDVLRIQEIRLVPAAGRMGVAFFSVPGKTYRVTAASAVQGAFSSFPLATTEAGATGADYWRGTGYYSWLYIDIPANTPQRFLRVEVE